MRIIKETPNEIRYVDYEDTPYPFRGKETKFLCIGGPSAAQKQAEMQLAGEDYVGFNAADSRRSHRRLTPSVRALPHSKIWVHRSLLV